MIKKYIKPLPLRKIISNNKFKNYKKINLRHINKFKSLDLNKIIRSTDDKEQFWLKRD